MGLADVKLEEIVKQNKTVTYFRPAQTVAEALSLLARARILSAPVVNEGDGGSPCLALTAWLDMQTILRGLLTMLKERHGKIPSQMLLLVKELEQGGPAYVAKTLGSIVAPPSVGSSPEAGGQDRALILESDISGLSLLEVIRSKFLSHGTTSAVHRCAVMNVKGEITAIVSQLDIVRYLDRNPALLGDLAAKTVGEIHGLVSRPVVSVDVNLPTLLAFDAMLKGGVSAAPVVSAQGELVANLSVSDMRCIQSAHLGSLGLPVAEFVALMHRTAYLGYSQRGSSDGGPQSPGSGPLPHFSNNPVTHRQPDVEGAAVPHSSDTIRLITCKPSSTFASVIQNITRNSVHRIYVLDPEQEAPHVIGVISLSDILSVVLKAATGAQ